MWTKHQRSAAPTVALLELQDWIISTGDQCHASGFAMAVHLPYGWFAMALTREDRGSGKAA